MSCDYSELRLYSIMGRSWSVVVCECERTRASRRAGPISAVTPRYCRHMSGHFLEMIFHRLSAKVGCDYFVLRATTCESGYPGPVVLTTVSRYPMFATEMK